MFVCLAPCADPCACPVVAQTHGILSEDAAANPYFHDWNHVFVWYCSSDSHLGDAPPGAAPWCQLPVCKVSCKSWHLASHLDAPVRR